jgi:transcription elongation factor GreA-like protein
MYIAMIIQPYHNFWHLNGRSSICIDGNNTIYPVSNNFYECTKISGSEADSCFDLLSNRKCLIKSMVNRARDLRKIEEIYKNNSRFCSSEFWFQNFIRRFNTFWFFI